METSDAEIDKFLADLARVLASLSGTAELKPAKVGTFSLRVSVDPRGAIKTEYEAQVWSGFGGRETGWQIKGSYLGNHLNYLKRLESEPAAG